MSAPAIDYNTLFARIGKWVKYINLYLAGQTSSGIRSQAAFQDIASVYTARDDLIDGVQQTFTNFQSNSAQSADTLKTYCDETLQDLQLLLNAPSNSVTTVLPILIESMVRDSQAVQKNTITSPVIAASINATNVGNGTLVAYDDTTGGIIDERSISEYVRLVCTADQFSGAKPGSEQFSITGYPASGVFGQSPSNGVLPRGNGNGSPISVSNESGLSLLTNGDFEDTSGTFPNNWTIAAGPTRVAQEATLTHPATGGTALKLAGDGTVTTVTLTQVINVTVNSTYGAGIFIRKGGTVTSGSTLTVSCGGVNLFSADPSTLTTSYALFNTFFNVPVGGPTTATFTITWTSANTAGASAVLYFDDAAVTAPIYFGYIGYVMYRGTVDFIAGDSFSSVTVNNYGGVFQTFFGRYYGVALPSSTGGGITQADALAT